MNPKTDPEFKTAYRDLWNAHQEYGKEATEPPPCPTCAKYKGFGPSHNGSRHCESGSIASGGDKAHCTCDFCF